MQVAVDTDLQRAKNIASERERTHQGTATPERIARAGAGFEKNVGREGAQRMVEAPLDKMFKSGRLGRDLFEAGDRFRGEAYLAAVNPGALTIDWRRAGGGGNKSNFVPAMFEHHHMTDASNRLNNMRKDLHGSTWNLLFDALVHEYSLEQIGLTHFGRNDKRQASAAGDAGLRVALCALSTWYAMGG